MKMFSKNIDLVKQIEDMNEKIFKLENNNFECIVCYCKNDSIQMKTKCGHDLCISCYNLLKDKRCPYCRKLI